jgi:hypothetical protein
VSDWNRPVRSRTQGGVGPVAGLTVSHGDPIRRLFGWTVEVKRHCRPISFGG